MKPLLVITFCFFTSVASAQTNCLQTAREVAPQLSAESRRDFETRLNQARELYEKDRNSADRIIWLGRRTAYLGRYKDAIRIFTDGIKRVPADAGVYRHRGHPFISLLCFDDAIADFKKPSKLINGSADEKQPDGLPKARNV